MNKKILLIVSVILVLFLVFGGYYYWKIKTEKISVPVKSVPEQATDNIQSIVASTSANIGSSVSPDITTPVIVPVSTDANPYNKTNPFSNLKTNPFQ